MPSAIPSILALLCLVTLSLPRARAHTWLREPPTYNHRFSPRTCRGSECASACPPYKTPMLNSPSRPARTLRRGDTFTVSWPRNNHHGGFFRASLVPLPRMHDRAWHARLALLHGCWESGARRCSGGKRECGTDKDGTVYSREVRVPTVFEDGDYVVGYVWYGGLQFRRKFGFFPDFWSCSHVRVEGGAPVGGTYASFFEAGVGDRVQGGQCETSADAVGDCGERGCPGKRAFWAVPRVFRTGGVREIGAQDVREGFAGGNVGARPRLGGQGGGGGGRGMCRSGICCALSCGKCGGVGCHLRPGGGDNCCMGRIAAVGRRCGLEVDLPCVEA